MKDFIKRLPLDIILQIIPYTYNLQNNNLLDDIVNYKKTKTTLLSLYYQFWTIEMQMQDSEEYINWLLNDIFAYANNYNASMYGYIDKFYNIFKRNIFLQTKEKIDKYVNKLEKKEVMIQINIFLGLLQPLEREDLIENFIIEI